MGPLGRVCPLPPVNKNMFRNRIHLPSRYGLDNYLVLTNIGESDTIALYQLVLDRRCRRPRDGRDSDGRLMFVDPEGGPFLSRGERVGRFTVKDVFKMGGGYFVKLGV